MMREQLPPSPLMLLVGLYGLAFAALFAAGIFIGLFRSQDTYVALTLSMFAAAIVLCAFLYMGPCKQFALFTAGLILAGTLGVAAEIWGTTNGFWVYHDLPDGRHLPYWLPFAWGLAFAFIYVVERLTIRLLKLKSLELKLALAIFLAALLPTWGEMVAINAGVWSYTWPLQIFGVPLLAILLLVIFHTGVNTFLSVICRRLHIIDPVFNDVNEALIDGRVTSVL